MFIDPGGQPLVRYHLLVKKHNRSVSHIDKTVVKCIGVLISNGNADAIKRDHAMQLVGERVKKLFGVAVHSYCLGHANECFVPRLKRRSWKDFGVVVHGPGHTRGNS
jgi:hypothetical protein